MFVKKRGFGKKAVLEDVLFLMIDLIILVIVFFFMMGYVDKAVESMTFEKNFLARDIALLIDTLYASPGDVAINYLQNTFWFSFKLSNNKVEVYEDDALPARNPSSHFIEDKNMGIEYKEIKPEKKIEDKESFIEKYLTPLSYFYSSKPKLEEGTFVKLFFGKEGNNIIADEIGKLDLNIDVLECEEAEKEDAKGAPLINWLADDPNMLAQETINKIDTAHISVITFTGRYDDVAINPIKAYIPPDGERNKKSKYLACAILNNIKKNDGLNSIIKQKGITGITSTSIIPSEHFSVLGRGNVIVLIEIGNANIEKDKNLLYDSESAAAIQESINRAIESMLIAD